MAEAEKRCPLVGAPCIEKACAFWLDSDAVGELGVACCAVVALGLIACAVFGYGWTGEGFVRSS